MTNPQFSVWQTRWLAAINAAQTHGVKSVRLEIEPPATEDEVASIEVRLGKQIPSAFKKVLLEFSRRVNFFWFLGDSKPSGILEGIYCGVCDWGLHRLIEMNAEVDWLVANAFVEDEPDHHIWKNKFPVLAIGNGDFIAINTSYHEPQYVVYLSHEMCYSHGYRLGVDFIEFMERWTQIGCVTDNIWPRFIDRCEDYIQLSHPNVRRWNEWFGLPVAISCSS